MAGNDTPGASGDDEPATSATLSSPTAIAVDSVGNLNIAEAVSHRIQRVSSDGVIRTIAGNGVNSYSGDGGSAIREQLSGPFAVAADSSGNFYVADTANNRIRKVSAGGVITSVAGNGTPGYSGDGGAATSAQLNSVVGLAVDSAGALYFTEYYNSSVRKVSPEGVITTIAGGRAGYSGDGGPATSASLNGPVGVAIDGSGAVYVADQQNYRVRKITPDGTITTVAGNGTRGFSGDGGPATSAQLDVSFHIAVDAAGNLYIADASNLRVRKVSTDGIIRTIAGTGAFGLSDDGAPAIESELYAPQGVATDSEGNIYISDGSRIRKIGTNGIIGCATQK